MVRHATKIPLPDISTPRDEEDDGEVLEHCGISLRYGLRFVLFRVECLGFWHVEFTGKGVCSRDLLQI